jgi:hypothetical protein
MDGSGDHGGFGHPHGDHHPGGGDGLGDTPVSSPEFTVGCWSIAFLMVSVMCFLPDMTPTVWIVLWSIVGVLVVGGPVWDFVRWLIGPSPSESDPYDPTDPYGHPHSDRHR